MRVYEVKIYYRGRFQESMGENTRKEAEKDFDFVMSDLDDDDSKNFYPEIITKGTYKTPLIGKRGPYTVKMIYVGDY